MRGLLVAHCYYYAVGVFGGEDVQVKVDNLQTRKANFIWECEERNINDSQMLERKSFFAATESDFFDLRQFEKEKMQMRRSVANRSRPSNFVNKEAKEKAGKKFSGRARKILQAALDVESLPKQKTHNKDAIDKLKAVGRDSMEHLWVEMVKYRAEIADMDPKTKIEARLNNVLWSAWLLHPLLDLDAFIAELNEPFKKKIQRRLQPSSVFGSRSRQDKPAQLQRYQNELLEWQSRSVQSDWKSNNKTALRAAKRSHKLSECKQSAVQKKFRKRVYIIGEIIQTVDDFRKAVSEAVLEAVLKKYNIQCNGSSTTGDEFLLRKFDVSMNSDDGPITNNCPSDGDDAEIKKMLLASRNRFKPWLQYVKLQMENPALQDEKFNILNLKDLGDLDFPKELVQEMVAIWPRTESIREPNASEDYSENIKHLKSVSEELNQNSSDLIRRMEWFVARQFSKEPLTWTQALSEDGRGQDNEKGLADLDDAHDAFKVVRDLISEKRVKAEQAIIQSKKLHILAQAQEDLKTEIEDSAEVIEKIKRCDFRGLSLQALQEFLAAMNFEQYNQDKDFLLYPPEDIKAPYLALSKEELEKKAFEISPDCS